MEALIGAALGGFVFGMVFTVILLGAIGRRVRGGAGSSEKIGMSEHVHTHTQSFEAMRPGDDDGQKGREE